MQHVCFNVNEEISFIIPWALSCKPLVKPLGSARKSWGSSPLSVSLYPTHLIIGVMVLLCEQTYIAYTYIRVCMYMEEYVWNLLCMDVCIYYVCITYVWNLLCRGKFLPSMCTLNCSEKCSEECQVHILWNDFTLTFKKSLYNIT